MLIVFGGLPGTGKTTISRTLAERMGAVYLRIDTIEQSLIRAAGKMEGPEGYEIAYAVAEDNLRAGNTVIADSVNPVLVTRRAWKDIAARNNAPLFEVEVVCSDTEEHRRRVESREADIAEHKQPTWQEVVNREYHEWPDANLVFDTARMMPDEIINTLTKKLTE